MAYSCKFVEKSAMKTRIEIIQEILDKIYDSSDIFDNDDVPYIPYSPYSSWFSFPNRSPMKCLMINSGYNANWHRSRYSLKY